MYTNSIIMHNTAVVTSLHSYTNKLVKKIVKHYSWPIQPDILNQPFLRLTSRKPLWLDLQLEVDRISVTAPKLGRTPLSAWFRWKDMQATFCYGRMCDWFRCQVTETGGFRRPSATVVSAEPFSHGTGTLQCLQKEMATYRH